MRGEGKVYYYDVENVKATVWDEGELTVGTSAWRS